MPNRRTKRLGSSQQKMDLDEPDVMEPVSDKTQNRTLPAHNAPEKIIIVLDRACDEVFSYFELTDGKKYRPLQMLKNSLFFFVHNKHFINENHQFALMVLNESSATWVLDFTNKVEVVIDAINNTEECETEDIFPLNSIFDIVDQKIDLPIVEDLSIPPPFVVRVVLTYARSFTLPSFNPDESINTLLNSPYFTVDVVMTHEIPDSSNKCESIFTELQKLNVSGKGYFYQVDRNSAKLHYAMGRLCGHPLQRPLQKN